MLLFNEPKAENAIKKGVNQRNAFGNTFSLKVLNTQSNNLKIVENPRYCTRINFSRSF